MLIDNILNKRKSTVLFSEKAVYNEDIIEMIKAAILAPSSNNQQPWRYVVANKEENAKLFNAILGTLFEGNIVWAQHAPVLIVSITEHISSYNEKPNKYAMHDAGMANAFLMAKATEDGFFTHPMGGFDVIKLKKILNLEKRYEPVCVIALGYKSDHENFDKKLIEREIKPRIRKPIYEIIFTI